MNIFERNAKKVMLAAIVASGFSAIFIKMIEAPSMVIGFYRLGFSIPVFAFMSLRWNMEGFKKLKLKDVRNCALVGVFLCIHFFTWFTGLKFTTVASAAVLGLTHPILILIVSTIFLKKRTNKKAVIGIIIAFLGCIAISGNDYAISGEALYGDLMAVLSAVFFAFYLMAGNHFRRNIDASIYVLLIFFFCWVSFGVGMVATATPFTGYPTTDYLWMLVLSIVCQVGAHATLNWCLGHLPALYISTCQIFEPVTSIVVALIVFSEVPTVLQLVGGAIALSGLMLYNRHADDKIDEKDVKNVREGT